MAGIYLIWRNYFSKYSGPAHLAHKERM